MGILLPFLVPTLAGGDLDPDPTPLYVTGGALFATLLFMLQGAALLTALRFGKATDPWQRRRLGLVGLALALYLGTVAGTGPFTLGTSPFDAFPGGTAPEDLRALQAWTVLDFAWLAGLAFVWLRNTRSGPGTQLACNVALTQLGMATAGLLVAANGQEFFGVVGIFHGVGRILGVLVLVYALLKGRLLGIDRPARTAVRSSALGGFFLAVFLVVAKVGENLTNDAAGGSGMGLILGSVAAGLLVFALHPLQRLSGRLAERAIPPSTPAADSVEIYREQATIAWRDGVVTRREHLLLSNLRDRLRLDAATASRIEHQAAGVLLRAAPRQATKPARARPEGRPPAVRR